MAEHTKDTRCRLVRDFASGAESAFRSGIYAPTSSLDSLRCVLALASLWDLWLITSDVFQLLSCTQKLKKMHVI